MAVRMDVFIVWGPLVVTLIIMCINHKKIARWGMRREDKKLKDQMRLQMSEERRIQRLAREVQEEDGY
jgi:hypothetical protein